MTRAVERGGSDRAPRFRLVFTEGSGVGATTLGPDGTVRIGRASAENDLCIDDAAVSRRHADITQDGSRHRLRDRGSQNGTLCNGERIGDDGVLLADGDLITVGRTTLRFELLPETPERAPEGERRPTAARAPVAPRRSRGRPARRVSERFGDLELGDRVVDYGRWQATVGWDPRTSRPIELIRLEKSAFSWFGRRTFVKAAEARIGLAHPSLQVPLAAGTDKGGAWVAVSHVPGISAYDVLRDAARDVPVGMVATIGCCVAEALGYLEDEVGPELRAAVRDRTVRIGLDGRAVLCDCGLPMPSPGDDDEPSIARYRAPEEEGGAAGDARAALFSTGVLLWELLAGDRVDPDQKTRLPPVDTMRLNLPRPLVTLVQRATEVRPDDRFASAADLAKALDRVCADLDVVSPEAAAAWLRDHFPSQVDDLEGEMHE